MNQELEDYFRSKIDQLEEEKEELKRKLAVICHVDIDNGEEFDWYILHRVWDLEDSLEKVIVLSTSRTDGVSAYAKKALERSRSLK